MRGLVDVNVFVALLWPKHTHHRRAHAWFRRHPGGWATNSVVESGALRTLTNPLVTRDAVSSASALRVIEDACSRAGHEFWPLDRPITEMLRPYSAKITGHRQWTDALLLAHAVSRGGQLITFDRGITDLAGKDARHAVVIA